MNKTKDKKSLGWILPLAFFLLTNPGLVIPVAVFGGIFGGIVWIAYQVVKMQTGSTSASASRTSTRYTTRKERFDDCSQPFFCRHRDKSEHHVRRGKEVDPWDRPDIDISKYQRSCK